MKFNDFWTNSDETQRFLNKTVMKFDDFWIIFALNQCFFFYQILMKSFRLIKWWAGSFLFEEGIIFGDNFQRTAPKLCG